MHYSRPLIFGEVLFDVFDDNTEVLGGAPFNVAWHLQGFGLDPLMITRIGRDERGERVLQYMRDWGMDTAGVQEDEHYPTGIVSVTLQEGQPTFDIVPQQAYDFISPAQTEKLLERDFETSIFYHGSLAARHDTSRQALFNLLESIPSAVFMDVNLRDPWWNMDILRPLLTTTQYLKLNEEELELITDASTSGDTDPPSMAAVLLKRYHLRAAVITRGERGALAVDASQKELEVKPRPIPDLKDTVGAGDAFSAVLIMGLIRNWPFKITMDRAMTFASAICSIRGATTKEQKLYDQFTSKWSATHVK